MMYIKGTTRAAIEIDQAEKSQAKYDLLSKDFLRIKKEKAKRMIDLNQAIGQGIVQSEDEIERMDFEEIMQ